MNSKVLAIIIRAEDKASKTMDKVGDSTEKSTGRMSKAFEKIGSVAKSSALLLGASFAGVITKFVAMGGISRALNIEDAQAKLKGLGHDTKTVETIMSNALASVKGTAYGLDAAATTAANAVASGIKPGAQLEQVLKTVANTASLAGRDMDELGAIFNKVAASNKVQMDVINQLHDAGVPALAALSKELGLSAEETAKLASEGKINFETFEKAMRTSVGNAAEEMGKTTRGSWANMKAAMARVGAEIAEDIIPRVRDAFQGMTKWIDDNQSNIVGSVNKIRDGVKDAFGQIGKFFGSIQKDIDTGDWKEVGNKIGSAIAQALQKATDSLAPIFEKGISKLKDIDWVGVGIELGKNVPALFIGLATGIMNFDIGSLFQGVWDHLPEIVLAGIGVALMPAKLVGGIGGILAKIPIVGKIASWFFESFAAVSKTIGGGVVNLLKSMGDGFINALGLQAPRVIPAITNFLGLLPTHIGLAAIKVWDSAIRMMERLGSAIASAGPKQVVAAAQKVKSAIISFFTPAANWLVSHGSSIMNGFRNGITNGFNNVKSWLAGIGSRVSGAIGNLGNVLWNAGSSIIGGFLGGIKTKFNEVKGFVGGIAEWIKNNKGPISYDRVLLVEAGEAIMNGLNKGLISGFEDVKRNVSGMGGQIAGSLNGEYTPTISGKYSMSGSPSGTTVAGSNTFNMYGTVNLQSSDAVDRYYERFMGMTDQKQALSEYGVGG